MGSDLQHLGVSVNSHQPTASAPHRLRGCGRGCRFCMAGYTYRPMREQSLDTILAVARHSLRHRDKIGLVSAAVSDHSWIDQIAVELRKMGARIAISSMRVDPISEPLVRALAESGTQTRMGEAH